MNRASFVSAISSDLPWGLRVRELRLRAGLKQEELAELIGTTKATISKIERSTGSPKIEWVEKLAPHLHVTVPQLTFGDAAGGESPVMLPVIGMISAGNYREAIQQTDEQIPVPGATEHMFVLRVDGDSIDRVAPDGAYVSIDPTNPTLTDGGLFAVQNGSGESTIKRFRRSPDRLEPDSTNPSHQPILLGAEPITIIGRATSVTLML